ncbi:MAG: S8 family serine peptidase [Helicobacteraceae bacterium]|jgi:kexin|nr:S8 family serine peptidase [Helicobacteraceae bacterium]
MKRLIVTGLFAFLTLSCGGGGSSGGGGGGASDIGDAYKSFPSFNESGLTIEQGDATKYYYYSSSTATKAVNDFATSLRQRGFSSGVGLCDNSDDFNKIDGNVLACAEIYEDGDFDVKVMKTGGAVTDSDFNGLFGSVPGDRYYTERLLWITYNAAFLSAVDSYKNALISAGFTCATNSGVTNCRKTDGDLYYNVEYYRIGGNGIVNWSVFVTGGIVGPEPDCTVATNTTYFHGSDYAHDPNVRFAQGDPLAVYQWYLKNFGQKSGSYYPANKIGEDINVEDVWTTYNKKGRNVTIGIVDSGTDFTNPDLKPAYKKELSYNYYSRSNNPYPVSMLGSCPHGTMTAGIAGARGSNGGVMGVAPQANLAGLNIGLGCGFSLGGAGISDALYSASRAIDVSSNSWGSVGPTPDSVLLENAIIEGAKSGRGGKGTIYVFAAGNDRRHNANGNYDSAQSLFESISVAALASDGKYTAYSNKGANLLVSAYGGAQTSTASGNTANDAWIFTTDIYGCAKGDSYRGESAIHRSNNRGQYSAYMNGTSAAAPMVSGVVALILEANHNLTQREVRYILATTARKNDSNDSDWKQNGANRNINHNYGFGAVNAKAAVEKARTFTSLGALLKTEKIQTIGSNHNFSSSQTKKINISESGIGKIEHVDVWVDINDASSATKLNITLKSPSGTVSELAYNDFINSGSGSSAVNWPKGFFNGGKRFGSARYLDESANGDWELTISGGPNEDREFRSWKIKIYGRSN